MTESSTSATTLKIRIRFDDAAPPVELEPDTRKFDQRRVTLALGALVLLLGMGFGIHSMMKHNSPEPVPAPEAEIAAPPASTDAPIAAVEIPIPALKQTNRVIRAVLTGAPRKNEPVQELAGDLLAANVTQRFYFFTEVHEVASRRFKHRWEYRGKAVAQILFSPKGKKWTGSSSKQIPTHMQGAWRVVLIDDGGAELSSVAFTYGKELTTAQN